MLSLLHIENVAIIERADVEFTGGLNIMTGETGAGKSIVIDAMSAALGGRLSRELVRTGAKSAQVSAVFDCPPGLLWSGDPEPDEDGKLCLYRRVNPDGKSQCRINGAPVSVAQLRDLGARLVNIHGQHDGQRLLNEATHREYLDSFAGMEAELAEYGKHYGEYRALLKERDALNLDAGEKERRMDSLRFRIDELERAELRAGEESELEERLTLLRNAGKLIDSVEEAFNALYGGDDTDGALTLIGTAESALQAGGRHSDELRGLAKDIGSFRYSVEDMAERLRDFRERLDFSPGELDEKEERLRLLRRLERKYGESPEAMLEYLEKCRTELESIEFSSDRLERIERELELKRADARRAALALSEKRQAAALRLEERIVRELSELSMRGVRFKVEFTEKPEGFDSTGMDEIRFLMAANAGMELGRISRVASGGELSRVMLAMKNALAENESIPTLVFDEIDTGVSGIAAQRVGEKLSNLARYKQVLCVTHLPQIAVMADAHYAIAKDTEDGKTLTHVLRLDATGRAREIARLYGGENVTGTAIRGAEEQLAYAAEYKAKMADK